MDERIIREIVTRQQKGERFAVGLLCHVQGSAPQRSGARLIVLPDGTMRGTVGGGCLEMETRRRALIALRTGETTLFDLRLDDDFGWDDGLICGGRTTLLVSPHPERMVNGLVEAQGALARRERGQLLTFLDGQDAGHTRFFARDIVPRTESRPSIETIEGTKVLVEPLRPQPRLCVCGCGHIGAAVVEYAASVGFAVTAIDDRVDYANPGRFTTAEETLCADMVQAAATLPTNEDTYWVIVTRGHRNDGKVLAALIGRPHAYVGMIGSRRKVRIIKEGLIKEGIATPEQLESLYSPIGLDIGAESPNEIALAIVAELIAVRHGKAKK